MGRTTIRRRLTLLFGVTIALVIALVGWLVSRQMTREMFLQARRAGIALAGSMAASSSNDFFNYNYVGLEQKAEEAVRDADVAYVIFYDKEGAVAAFSGQGKPDAETHVPPLEPEAFGGGDFRVTDHLVLGKETRGLDILVAVTMAGSGTRWGTVRLGLRLDAIYSRIARTRLSIFFLGGAGILLGWVLAAMFTRRITVPLKDLVNATVKVSEGEYEVDLDVRTGDEVQDLAENFRSMTLRIREARQALEENLRQIRELKYFSDLVLLSITDGLMTLDGEGKIVTFNRRAEQVLGVSSQAVLGRTPGDIWGEDSPVTLTTREDLRTAGAAASREIRLAMDGQERTIEVTTAPIMEAEGPAMGLLVLFDDLTEKKLLEERVRRADRLAAMGTLAAGLAHEIKNPLTAVRAFVQMFPERYGREDFREKFGRIVPRELDRVNELLENLLDLVRKPRMSIHPVETRGVIDHVLEMLEPEAEKRGIVISCPGRESSPRVLADESYLTRALHNIVLNAIQAMPGGGRLTIEAGAARAQGGGRTAEISITDTGPGIPEGQVGDIFNPFFTSKEKGTGLGLAVTNKIIEDLGGTVRVETGRAVGTTFLVTLPMP
ncbi:MAG: PAS domain S-box protein [bacterium]|nr:MAG: PAS domain S-box protein [bacterium]